MMQGGGFEGMEMVPMEGEEGGEGGGDGDSQLAEAADTEYHGPSPEMLAHSLHTMVKDMFDVDALENDTMLMDIGIDSLSMLDFHSRIAREIPGVTWSPTMLFDYPTLNELADMMEETLRMAFEKQKR